jgi:hypothetical protein
LLCRWCFVDRCWAVTFALSQSPTQVKAEQLQFRVYEWYDSPFGCALCLLLAQIEHADSGFPRVSVLKRTGLPHQNCSKKTLRNRRGTRLRAAVWFRGGEVERISFTNFCSSGRRDAVSVTA